MKIAGIVIINAGCILYGLYRCSMIYYRLSWLNELQRILLYVKGEVKYAKAPVDEIIELCINKTKNSDYKKYLHNIADTIMSMDNTSLSKIFETEGKNVFEGKGIIKEDYEYLVDLGRAIENTDSEMNVRYLEMLNEKVTYAINEYRKTTETQCRVYRCCSITVGIIICLLLV